MDAVAAFAILVAAGCLWELGADVVRRVLGIERSGHGR